MHVGISMINAYFGPPNGREPVVAADTLPVAIS